MCTWTALLRTVAFPILVSREVTGQILQDAVHIFTKQASPILAITSRAFSFPGV